MGIFDTSFTADQQQAIDSDRPNNPFAGSVSIPKAISERHVACVFLLDVSGSMNRQDAIGKLNEGMIRFKEYMQNDSKISNVVDVAVVTFGQTVSVIQDFIPVSELNLPVLKANGQTPLGEALKKGIELIDRRKEVYKATGTPYFRPWLFCLTDGIPTDDWHDAASKLKQIEDAKGVLAWCVCIENDTNFKKDDIKQIFNPKRIGKLENLDFNGLFEFVSNSLTAVSQSTPGETTFSAEVPRTLSFEF